MVNQSYEESQAKLNRSYNGDPEDFHIDVPKDIPEINPEILKDVEPLLFKGFLYVPAEINGASFVFKSLNHHEFEMLSLLAPIDGTRKALKRFYSMFLAYGVFMIEGENILVDRERWLSNIVTEFDSMGDDVVGKIVRHLSEINRRANKAVILTEAYVMEFTSRNRWAQLRGLDLTSTSVTGIRGTNTLGMNWGQLTWRALNYYEDLKDQAELDWENAMFIASSMAGKGMNRVRSQDKRRREQEREGRLERRDKILRFAVLGEPMDQPGDNVPMMVARTVEELAVQLEKDLKGEKDWHDLVVEAHERKAQEERQAQLGRIREMQQNFDAEYGPRQLQGSTDLTGLSPDELKFQLEHRRQLTAQRLASQIDPAFLDPKAAQFTEKWSSLQRDADHIPLVPTSDRQVGIPFRSPR
jgi:hypothetical protein